MRTHNQGPLKDQQVQRIFEAILKEIKPTQENLINATSSESPDTEA